MKQCLLVDQFPYVIYEVIMSNKMERIKNLIMGAYGFTNMLMNNHRLVTLKITELITVENLTFIMYL